MSLQVLLNYRTEPNVYRVYLLGAPKTFLRIIFLMLAFWNLAIIAAPFLVQSQMQLMRYLGSVVYFFLDPVCHQLPDRSLYLMQLPLPVCGRCTSIYFAGLLTIGWVVINNRFTQWHRYVYLALSVVVAVEIFIEKIYLIENWTELRLISGLILGVVIFRLILEGVICGKAGKINE